MRSIKLPSWSSRLLGLEPVPLPPHVFGLEQGSLAYGNFERQNGRLHCLEYHHVELPADLFGDGPLGGPPRDAAVFRDRLEALLELTSAPIEEASLVLPDSWLRMAFAEVGELPSSASARAEILRWKLRNLVPYRVEELRLRALEVPPLPRQEEPRRVLLAFAIDVLLAQLEGAFQHRAIRLGQVTNMSLGTLGALADRLDAQDRALVAWVGTDGYGLVFTHRGEPYLYRYRGVDHEVLVGSGAQLVLRDLRLTRSYLSEELGQDEIGQVLLVGPQASETVWTGWLKQAFETEVTALRAEHLPLGGEPPPIPLHDLTPLLGAVAREVA